jgi:hypothetical protein
VSDVTSRRRCRSGVASDIAATSAPPDNPKTLDIRAHLEEPLQRVEFEQVVLSRWSRNLGRRLTVHR